MERSPLVYLDANVFIRAFESGPGEAGDLRLAFTYLQKQRILAATSELTLAKLLAPNRRKDSRPPRFNVMRDFYLNLILWNGLIDLRPVTRETVIATADLRQNFTFKLPDAIHVVTALETGCTFFLSGDQGTKRLPQGLIHLLPDEAGIRTLMEALRA
ncbi:MAG: PIN domain-containing protein [Beijerinckiaceae bacterium]|nr:PIN domain-containing protein [Beijerinckiaceae bacterium]